VLEGRQAPVGKASLVAVVGGLAGRELGLSTGNPIGNVPRSGLVKSVWESSAAAAKISSINGTTPVKVVDRRRLQWRSTRDNPVGWSLSGSGRGQEAWRALPSKGGNES
jgi:hypothetical protein